MSILKTIFSSSEELCLNEIVKNSKVPLASAFRILKEFTNQNFIEKKVWKNTKTYTLVNNEKTAFLKDLLVEEFDGVKAFLEGSKEMTGISKIILHGKAGKSKANILVIGENIDLIQVKQLCSEIKSKGFNLSFVPLAMEQYNQMVEMGLYGGEKTVLRGD